MPDLVLNYECSFESKLSLHSSFITVSALQPETQTSPSAKTPDFVLKNSLRIVTDYLITYSIQKLTRRHVFFSEALFLL